MTALEALQGLRLSLMRTRPRLPRQSATSQEARQLVPAAAGPSALAPELIARLYDRLYQAQRLYVWRRLKRVEWRLSPYLLWRGEPALITRFGLFERFKARLEAERSGAMARRLIQAWLVAYDDAMPMKKETAAAISE